jgi:hypothetical protein
MIRMASGVEMEPHAFHHLSSWSINYCGCVVDDARCSSGIWYYRNIITGEIQSFAFQDRVAVICENWIDPSADS